MNVMASILSLTTHIKISFAKLKFIRGFSLSLPAQSSKRLNSLGEHEMFENISRLNRKSAFNMKKDLLDKQAANSIDEYARSVSTYKEHIPDAQKCNNMPGSYVHTFYNMTC